ncbi:probable leucine-rich repeat receptor-like serine/threonine-protein kinase At3g14840 isoform X3 [Daucus carota subsp. sativus]|uniref:probable leucine-rich repeat receptor-like serine/threonine-protein kinase At3g14840 isoform X3 n=1 Tax=Daucus carota subsp. sativus TaxID=79200 RepID=UPI0030834B91
MYVYLIFIFGSIFQNWNCRILRSQNLPGKLPPEFAKLPYLQVIDLSINYIEGTLPLQWASLRLRQISLRGNRLTGPIPEEYGSIATLEKLDLNANQMSGNIPPKLGDLPAISAMLTSLTDFRISDNNFTGRIPSYIQTWTKLKKLEIQASGLDGPIPDFSLLADLKDLRISDLNGNDGKFPSLNKSSFGEFQRLILRSCNIVGQLPEYLGEMQYLTTLDLSFNRLSGNISSTMSNLSSVKNIYFAGNLLSGSLPDWIFKSNNIDLSYNNLTLVSSEDDNCLKEGLNLFGSSSKSSPSGMVSCLQSQTCSRYVDSFYINCGGKQTSVDGNKYAADRQSSTEPSKFYRGENWASSSTGSFVEGYKYNFTRTSSSFNGDHRELLMDARLSPLSLTYYGFCLANGKYTVKLYFAEITFTDNHTFSSLGRRIFDIYIQGKLERKDFNIKDEAGGINKEVVVEFPVSVDNHTLEIRFYWAGKGTTIIPLQGIYGPLISAIAASHAPVKRNVSVGTVVGVMVGIASVLLLLLGILWWRGCLCRRNTMRSGLQGLDLHTGSFTLQQIRAATKNFDSANKIGEGGFGPVYKGVLLDGTVIAVKQLSHKSTQGTREFVTEIGMISALQHPNLVKLYGCCVERNELMLVYEYLENNSLFRALFGPERDRLELNWSTRYKVCIGIARGLAYLHEESRLKIVHRDIKATNVLLDKDLNPKISDFGLAKLAEEDKTHISTRIAGTFGYMAPEYAMRGYLTDKADVYSFGIVALEIVSGRSNSNSGPKQEPIYLLDWAYELEAEGKLMELVDESLGSEYEEEVLLMIHVGLLCTNATSAERPAMSSVVSILEGRADIQELVHVSDQTMEMKQQHQSPQSISIEEDSWIASSASGTDLYTVTFDTDYMLKNDSGR